MHYMGINNSEGLVANAIHRFQSANPERAIFKILAPPETYRNLQELVKLNSNVDMATGEIPLTWNLTPIERSGKVKKITIIPSGELSGAIYE